MDYFLYLFSFILILTLTAFYASLRFAQLATSKGYPPTKAKRYPFIILFFGIFLTLIGQTVIHFLASSSNNPPLLLHTLIIGWSLLIIAASITILHKAYKNIQSAPNKIPSRKETHKLT